MDHEAHPAAVAYFAAFEAAIEDGENPDDIELLGLGKKSQVVVEYSKLVADEVRDLVCTDSEKYSTVRSIWQNIVEPAVTELLTNIVFPSLPVETKRPIVALGLEVAKRSGRAALCRDM